MNEQRRWVEQAVARQEEAWANWKRAERSDAADEARRAQAVWERRSAEAAAAWAHAARDPE